MITSPNQTSARSTTFLFVAFAFLLLVITSASYVSFNATLNTLIATNNTPASEDVANIEVRTDSLEHRIEKVQKNHLITFLCLIAATVLSFMLILKRVRQLLDVQQATITHQASYDSLTGLANRTLFWDRIKLAIAQANRQQKLVAVVRINIDRFNQINTGLGNHIADQVLVEIAQRLKRHTRACDTVARMGGDDFAIVLGDIDRKDEIENTVKRVLHAVHETCQIESHALDISTSSGVAVYPSDQNDVESLVFSADSAMLKARREQPGRYLFFTSDMGIESTSHLQEEQELKRALENNEFCLHYQPKVDSTSGTIKGFEALIRWNHPERGLVPPNLFIPLLEESGLIIPVGEWVIRETCEALQRWKQQGLPVVPVSVNVAGPQFNQKDFVSQVSSILQQAGIAPELLEIEITESCLMSDNDESVRILQGLKQLGTSISIDDFGTGYSSLSHLNKFPIDTLKIDRSFITEVNNRQKNDNAGIVTAIMALSHSLRLNVVAEGVETAQELAFLHALGCRTIQGFLFSKPLTESDVIALLKNSQSLNDVLVSVHKELSA